jgi:hypothetical protein
VLQGEERRGDERYRDVISVKGMAEAQGIC